MNYYTKEGYIRYSAVINPRYPFTVIYGGRGVGKTYGILQYCIENKIPFIYMRHSQSMVEQLGTDALNPTKAVFNDLGENCSVKKSGKYIYRFVYGEKLENECGIMVALSTFSNLRGFDASDYKVLVFDEFIPQEEVKRRKNDGLSFLNAIETISRNRELQGRPPILTFLLTNANTLNSDILIQLNLFDSVLQMQEEGSEIYFDKARGLQVFRPKSKISEQKRKTSLYKFAGDGRFSSVNLDNEFQRPDAEIRKVNTKGWKCIASIKDLAYIYKKGKRYYISTHKSGQPTEYVFDKKGKILFMRNYPDFLIAIAEKRAIFQTLKLYYQLSLELSIE